MPYQFLLSRYTHARAMAAAAPAPTELTSEQAVQLARECITVQGPRVGWWSQEREDKMVTWLRTQPGFIPINRVLSICDFLDMVKDPPEMNDNWVLTGVMMMIYNPEERVLALRYIPTPLLDRFEGNFTIVDDERERRFARSDINTSNFASFMHRNGMRDPTRIVDEMLHGPGRLKPLPARHIMRQPLVVGKHWVDARWTPAGKRPKDDDADDDKPRKRLP